VNIVEFAIASQDAKLAALKAAARVPTAESLKVATLTAIMRVEADALGWANVEDVVDAIEAAWEKLEAG
jgi:uncharacterized protein (DUF1501 family)